MYLIVNADDCGYSPGINRGIIHALQRGIVTSTTLMVNQPYSREAAILLAEGCFPAGLHLNLTRGRPVSEPGHVLSLRDQRGFFHLPGAVKNVYLAVTELEKEIEAQLGRLESFGLTPTHIDVHHHLQCHPPIRAALIKVAAKYQLPLRHSCTETKNAFKREAVVTPDCFISSFYDTQATTIHLCELLKKYSSTCPENSVVELMTHPGFCDGNTAASSYDRQRLQELEALCSPEVRELAATLQIKMVDYRILHKKN